MSDRIVEMQTVLRAVDGGSLSAGARALGKSLAAVSRTVTQLEERLGVLLLHRSTRRLVLTEAGVTYCDSARRILAEIEDAEASIGGRAAVPRGTLTVTAPLLFGRLHVAPVVVEMLEKHRDVMADLMLVDRNVSLVEEGVDVAVRIGRLDDSALVARKLGQVPRVVCAAPSYLRRRGTPRAPEDLRKHECLRFGGLVPGREWTFERDGKAIRVAVSGRFNCNVGEPVIDAACAGVGVVMALGYQVEEDIAQGRLVRLLPKFEPPPVPVSAVYHSPRLLAARVRAFLDLLSLRIPSGFPDPNQRLATPVAGWGVEWRPKDSPVMALYALGLNHTTAPVEVRERVAFPPDQLGDALRDLVAARRVKEAAILSTCNRTEVYFRGDDPEPVAHWLAGFHNLRKDSLLPYVYTLPRDHAVTHAFRVASGLDSMVLGEPQILGQMKHAVRSAEAAGSLGLVLNRLFQRTFAVAKEVRTQTDIGSASISMAAAAVKLAERIFPSIADQRLLLIGAGEMIELRQPISWPAIRSRSPWPTARSSAAASWLRGSARKRSR